MGSARSRRIAASLVLPVALVALIAIALGRSGVQDTTGPAAKPPVTTGTTTSAVPTYTRPPASAAAGRPNVILFVTDDQDFQTVRQMPFVSSFDRWVRFPRSHVNNSDCCPARATLLSGQYSNHTGVEFNDESRKFNDAYTLPTWLQAAGYRTGLFGKYFNRYPWRHPDNYVPPGWDTWSAFTKPSGAEYYDYTLNEDGALANYGADPRDYSNTVLTAQAMDFLKKATARPRPFFLYFAPFGPHKPRIPAPGDAGTFSPSDFDVRKNFNEPDVTDKPRWVRELKRSRRDSAGGTANARETIAETADVLQSEDRSLEEMFHFLRDSGELRDTVIIFTSDNGFSYGSHWWTGKICMYEECGLVPFLVFDPRADPGTNNALVSNVDIAPTVAALAGADPTHRVDGESLVPLIRGRERSLHRPLLLRSGAPGKKVGVGWGIETRRYVLIRNEQANGSIFDELYDLKRDPYQLHNLLAGAHAEKYADLEGRLRKRLVQLRGQTEAYRR